MWQHPHICDNTGNTHICGNTHIYVAKPTTPLSPNPPFQPTFAEIEEYETIIVERLCGTAVDSLVNYDTDTIEENFTILPQVKILVQSGQLQAASDLYSDRLQEQVKLTVKTTVTECSADALSSSSASPPPSTPSPSPSSAITSNILMMTFAQFMSCLEMLFEQILSLLSRASSAHSFLVSNGVTLPPVTGTKSGPQGTSAETPTSGLAAAAELAHRSISELLRIRKDKHSLLSLPEIKQLWDSILAFTLEVETHR